MYKLTIPLLLISTLNAASHDNKLEIGFTTTSYNYTERDSQDKILDTEKSDFFGIGGIYGSYEHKVLQYSKDTYNVDYYIEVYASATYGNTDYVGSLLSPALSPAGRYGSYRSTTENTFYEFETNLKRAVSYEESTTYVLAGLGYKYWERKLSSIQKEEYYYFLVQIAIGAETIIYKDWSLGIDLTGQVGIDPKMDAKFTGSSGSLNETYDLGPVYTYKIAAPLTIPICKKLSFTTKLEYDFTSISKSNTIITPSFTPCSTSGCYEPDSQQKNWNLYAGIQLLF